MQSSPLPKLLIAVLALALCGCSAVQTITPTRVRSHTSSYDSSTPKQYADRTNSGVLELVRDAHGQVTHAIVTPHFCAYVQTLLADYGDQLAPPLEPGKELPPGTAPHTDRHGNALFKVDTEHFDKYRQLARWKKSNRERTGAWAKLMNKI